MKVVRKVGRRVCDWRSRRLPERAWQGVGIAVMVAVHNRSGRRVENFFRTLRSQTMPPDQVDLTLVDYGSDPAHSADLRARCWDWRARFIRVPTTTAERRRGQALNCALRRLPEWLRFVVSTDIDMIFAPNFLESVVRTQLAYPPCLTLCRFIDLRQEAIGDDTDVVAEFDRIRTCGEYYDDCATGPCLAASREWWHRLRGFDERLFGEDHDDYDTQCRAKQSGLVEVWIHDRTALCHQWHWRRFEAPQTPEEAAEQARYKQHWDSNRAIVLAADNPVRNLAHEWGVLPPGGEVIEPPERRR